MYNSTDIQNILNATEYCPKEYGDKICKSVKKGNTCVNTLNINTYESVAHLLQREDLEPELVQCLIDIIQDICEGCELVSSTASSVVSTDCHEDNIITESGICLITESGNNIIIE